MQAAGGIERAVKRASALALAFNVFQTAVKLFAALLTGSVSILTETIHSATDLLASGISFVAVRYSVRDPDDDHPFGHGKFDSLAGFAEAVLLIAFSAGVGAGAGYRLLHPAPLARANVGAYLVGAMAVGAFLVSTIVGRAAESSGSSALRANRQHLRLDALVSAGVAISVIVGGALGWPWLDPVVALAVAATLLIEASRLARRAFGEVVDERIEAEEIAKITAILDREPELLGFHRLRTRHSGPVHDVDLHIVLPDDYTVAQGHAIAHRIEQSVAEELAPARCVVHVDPASEADHDD